MSISVDKDSEFTIVFKDFIETLAGTEYFDVKIWVNGSEIPYEYNESSNFHFLNEGIRVSTGNTIDYLFYDMISGIRIMF